MKRIRTLIVDDERLARQKVRTLLEDDEEIEVVGECANGTEAIAAVRKQKPDLLLLDIEMPGHNGFEVLQRLRSERLPMVVFITAHDEYAVRAFEVEAVDYVMKPFDRKRFHDALRRAKRQLNDGSAESEARLIRLLERVVKPKSSLDHFVVKARDRTFLVPVIEVDWIEAEGKYVRLHAAAQQVQRLKAVLSFVDLAAALLEEGSHHQSGDGVILDHQDGRTGAWPVHR